MSRPNFNAYNGLSTAPLFFRRLSYELFALRVQPGIEPRNLFKPTLETLEIKDFDLAEKRLRGKLFLDDGAIVPKRDKLKQVKFNDQTPVYALDFVADAFDSLAVRYQRAFREGLVLPNRLATSPSAILGNPIQAKKGASNTISNYKTFQRGLSARFTTAVTERKKRDLISPKDVFDFYRDYLLQTPEPIYFASGYVRSRFNSQLNTGLAIEIDTAAYDLDRYKIDNFYKSSNFRFYKDAAYVFGFHIDKDIPWRLVADLSSPQMQFYMKQAGAQYTGIAFTLLDNFNIIDLNDFNSMLDNFLNVYNLFARQNKTTAVIQEIDCKRPRRDIVIRNPADFTTLLSMGLPYWLDMYVDLKNKFSTLEFNTAEVKQIKRTAIGMAEPNSLARAVQYVNDKYSSNNHFEGSINYELTKESFKQQGIHTSMKEAIKRDTAEKMFKIY